VTRLQRHFELLFARRRSVDGPEGRRYILFARARGTFDTGGVVGPITLLPWILGWANHLALFGGIYTIEMSPNYQISTWNPAISPILEREYHSLGEVSEALDRLSELVSGLR
jgi:hypothetical protein